jgi:hypothetical protein
MEMSHVERAREIAMVASTMAPGAGTGSDLRSLGCIHTSEAEVAELEAFWAGQKWKPPTTPLDAICCKTSWCDGW